jgi:hypothetical protein
MIPMGDMTREAATQKMMYAVGLAKSYGLGGQDLIENVRQTLHRPIGYDISMRYSSASDIYSHSKTHSLLEQSTLNEIGSEPIKQNGSINGLSRDKNIKMTA